MVVHREDLPILPGKVGDLRLLGFGLWETTLASIVLALVTVVVGSVLNMRASQDTARTSDEDTQRGAQVLGYAVLGWTF
ncbi:MAG: hypothetical protein M3456_02245 [Actinomycetota bacterium]|nr:hypothetical protein [Actinomycetota bacterium]